MYYLRRVTYWIGVGFMRAALAILRLGTLGKRRAFLEIDKNFDNWLYPVDKISVDVVMPYEVYREKLSILFFCPRCEEVFLKQAYSRREVTSFVGGWWERSFSIASASCPRCRQSAYRMMPMDSDQEALLEIANKQKATLHSTFPPSDDWRDLTDEEDPLTVIKRSWKEGRPWRPMGRRGLPISRRPRKSFGTDS